MTDILRERTAALSDEENLYLATHCPTAWVGERIRKALVAGGVCWGDSQLLSVREVEQEILERGEAGRYRMQGGFEWAIEEALLDALLASLHLQAERVSPDVGMSLVWRFCYRLAQVAALVADAGRDEAYQKGKLGGPKARGDNVEAKRLARQYLRKNAFDAAGKIRPQKVLELEIWEMLFARRDEPGAFQIAGSPGRPTERAVKTVRSFIAADYRRMRVRGQKMLESDQGRLNGLAIEVYARRRSQLQKVDVSPDASPEQVEQ